MPAVLQLVVDVSGSMDERAPGSSESKWTVTHAALEEAIGALGPDTAIGALLYPNQPWWTGESVEPRPISECVAIDEMLPIDVLGDAPPDRYGLAVEAAQDDPNVDAIIVLFSPQAMTCSIRLSS